MRWQRLVLFVVFLCHRVSGIMGSDRNGPRPFSFLRVPKPRKGSNMNPILLILILLLVFGGGGGWYYGGPGWGGGIGLVLLIVILFVLFGRG